MTNPVWRPSRLASACLVAVAVGVSLALLGGTPAVAGMGAVAPGPDLVVDAAGPGGHAISSDIYGVNFVPTKLGRQIDVPVDRWGGDSAETYNWLIGADNAGADWYFEDISDCWTATYAYCSGHKTNNVRAYRATDRARPLPRCYDPPATPDGRRGRQVRPGGPAAAMRLPEIGVPAPGRLRLL
ncbi:MAG: hypothetical protein ACLPUG_02430 [Acidimicrobiales bacterium]